jgi:DNA gyrase subunit A
MRLGRLTGLEREKLENEYNELLEKIRYYKEVLANELLVHEIIKDELTVIKNKYADDRRTKLEIDEDEIDMEDLIQEEESVITMTHFGYIKRLPADTYKSQRRGGKGIIGLSTREEDFVKNLFVTSTHHFIMFFTNKGRVYRLKAYEIPEAGRQAKGTAIVNLLQLDGDEKVTTVIPIQEYKEGQYLVMATRNGLVKKTDLMEYNNIRKGGLGAVTLRENDELIDVKLTDGNQDIMLSTVNGMAIRFNETDARPIGRVSQGVKGIELDEDDHVIGMEVCTDNTTLLVVTENGFGKRTELDEYKVQSRGGKGVLTYRITEKTGKSIGMMLVSEDDDIILISSDGTIIRMKVNEISILGRATQGVTLMRMSEGNNVVSMARMVNEEEEENGDIPEYEDEFDTDSEAADSKEEDSDSPDGL